MNALILAEGSTRWGMGHLFRCLGLAQELERRGFHVRWGIVGDEIGADFIREHGLDARSLGSWDLEGTLALVEDILLVVLDSYHAPLGLLHELAARIPHRLWVDDQARLDYPAGHVLNPNPGIVQISARDGSQGKHLLSGYSYQPLRKEFRDAPRRTHREQVETVLILTGGTDIQELTPRIIHSTVGRLPNARIAAVVPSDLQRLRWNHLESPRVELLPIRTASQMRRLMEASDIAISAGGQSLLECVRTGLPTIAIEVADNQKHQIAELARLECIVRPTESLLEDGDFDGSIADALAEVLPRAHREALGSACLDAVDGGGCRRAIAAALGWSETLHLREAELSDGESLWSIPGLPIHPADPRPASLEQHIEGFNAALGDRALLLLAVVDPEGSVVGQVRYSILGSVATVNLQLAPQVLVVGDGALILREGTARLSRKFPGVERLRAEIPTGDTASIQQFLRVGFLDRGIRIHHGDREFFEVPLELRNVPASPFLAQVGKLAADRAADDIPDAVLMEGHE